MASIRVLQVVPNMQAGGLETFIMNIYRNIDRKEVQFDFLVHYNSRKFYDDEIEKLGGKIYRLTVREDKNVFKYIKDLNSFFKEHKEYKIIHGHMHSTACFYLRIAQKYNIPVRILHSHTTSQKGDKNLKLCLKRILTPMGIKYANNYFACSIKAGKWLFKNKPFKIINNAIDTNKFAYNPEIRKKLRKELNVEDKFVIGHVGRLTYAKNHEFLIDIFNEVYKKNPNSVLLLVGDGELREKIQQKVHILGLNDAVRFLNVRKDVNELYQAMDTFLLPSHYEGLPVVCIEAQVSGLPCVISENVTNEIKITENVYFVSLEKSAKEWAQVVLSMYQDYERKDMSDIVRKTGYNIKTEAKRLKNIYLEMVE